MEMMTAVALFYCRIWPCQALIAAGAGAAAGAVAGYFAAQSVVKQFASKTRV